MSLLVHELRLLLVGWQFLTRVPLPPPLLRWLGYEADWLHASARHFPLIGGLVGMAGAAVLAATAPLFGAPVAAGLSMAATLWLTGGFHEDGWADTCDGLGGSAVRERALEIMKDSRIGAYGAMGLVLMLGLKWASLAALPVGLAVVALPLAHAASRTVAVSLIRWLPYAGDLASAKAKPLSRRLSTAGWLVTLAWAACFGVLAVLAGLPAQSSGAALLACAGAGLATRRWFARRLGGYTGDCLGAAQQLAELGVYLVILAAWRWSA
ncbi:adenosylcobinamide-GDP ribazoletransferase [Aquabacterium sp. A7-Y]|uniref:adenosylcobinamide-GDP ribazoletransferase n=1 Tax=Aquabacterium sp. A7-Y TaxID=1349605 RepID=UPI00223E7D5D|nr:adenosylcobinamide-GDP ribazoletransferase [Aquabacterium sp. A7-Y]MCW7537557.1 adenosylcobinamide-GDP ribazoletransferase [Aquabacterium sp. A7-Y]